jgi:hypothetical protein
VGHIRKKGENLMDEKTNDSTLPEPEENASETLKEEQLNLVAGGGDSGSTDPVLGVKLNHNQNVA